MSEEKDTNKVNEPSAEYMAQKKLGEVFNTITFSTLEEMDNERRQYSADLSPIERMAYLYKLNQIAFGELLKQPVETLWIKEITIDNRA